MTYVFLSDLTRFYVVVSALWLAALFVKMTWSRYKVSGSLIRRQETPHPLVMVGLALLMILAAARRFERYGQPGDGWLWVVTVAITLILAGVLINVQFTVAPPWRRHDARR